jgi:hypothetical protein
MIPRATDDGSLMVVATALDRTGVKPDTTRLSVLDTASPYYGWYLSSLDTPHGQTELSPTPLWLGAGETDAIHVAFADNRTVTWLGYRIGAPVNIADSVPSRGRTLFFAGDANPTDTATLTLRVNPAWYGMTPHFSLFARDGNGNLGEVDFGATPIGRWKDRTARTLTLGDSASDVAIDAKRQLLYLSIPSRRQIAVVDIATAALRATIDVPAVPLGLDLTVSGDSLIVALHNRAALGVVDLARATLAVDTIPIGIDTTRTISWVDSVAYLTVWPDRLRVAANGRVVMSTTWPWNTSPSASRIVVFDPATRTTTRYAREAMWHQAVGRNGDRSRVVIADGLNDFARYDPSANAVSFAAGGADGPVSLNATGDRVLAWAILHDAQLNTLRQFTDSRFATKASVLTGDGTAAIVASRGGPTYYVFRTSDGLMQEQGSLPFVPHAMALTADDSTLILLGDTAIALVDMR